MPAVSPSVSWKPQFVPQGVTSRIWKKQPSLPSWVRMVNNQLGELLDRDLMFIAPDQGQWTSGERSENIAYWLRLSVEKKVTKVTGMEWWSELYLWTSFTPGHRNHSRYQAPFHDRQRFGDLLPLDRNRNSASYPSAINQMTKQTQFFRVPDLRPTS